MAQNRPASGFTLIEAMVALAVVAITTMLAASSYRHYLRRGERIDAVQALLAAAVEQEKFHLTHGHYGDRLGRKWLIASGMWVQAAGLLLIAATRGFGPWLGGAVLLTSSGVRARRVASVAPEG